MGLLDDAIREHLELKRRHGADPSEVARQEQEALGPVRRAAEPAVTEPEPEPRPDEPVADASPVEQHTEVFVPEFEPEPEEEPQPPAARGLDPGVLDQPTVEHPAARPDDEIVDGPDPEPAPAAQPEARDGDVLEDTPEFLEETPEHDRLWFEQRPPRDFDF